MTNASETNTRIPHGGKGPAQCVVRGLSNAWDRVPFRWVEVFVAFVIALVTARALLMEPYLGVALIVLLLAGVALLRRPVLLIYSIFLMVPIHWVNLLGDRLRVVSVLSMIAFAYFFATALVKRDKIGDRTVYAYLLFLAVCLLSMIVSVDIAASVGYLRFWVFSLLFGYATILAVRTRESLRVIVWILTVWGIGIVVLALLQSLVSPAFFPANYFTGFGMAVVRHYAVSGINRASGTFENGPRMAMFLMLPFALTLVAAVHLRGRGRAAAVAALALYVPAFVVSFTRAAWVLTAGMLPLVFILERRRRTAVKSVAGIVIGAAVIGMLAALFLPDAVLSAAVGRVDASDSATYKDRFYFLWNALNAFADNPLLGLGVGTYGIHSWDLMQRYPVPWRSLRWDPSPFTMPDQVPVHNTYGRVAAETGVFGLLALLAIFAFTILNLRRVMRESQDPFLRQTALGLLVYFLCMCVFWFPHEYVIEEPFVSVIPTALSVVLVRLMKSEDGARPVDTSEDNRLIRLRWRKGRTEGAASGAVRT